MPRVGVACGVGSSRLTVYLLEGIHVCNCFDKTTF